MNPNDTVSEVADRIDAQDPDELPEPASSLVERLQPHVSEGARSGTLAVATGVVSLVRAVWTIRKGKRKRGVLQALGGLVWMGIALAQRRATGRESRSGVEQTDVADTGPNIEDVETPAEYGGEPATGENVVDTTPADIEESDTAPDLDSDVDAEGVEESDVVGTDETEFGVEDADTERDDSAMEFGDPEMDVGDVERQSGEPDMEAGEMGTHADEDAVEDENENESSD